MSTSSSLTWGWAGLKLKATAESSTVTWPQYLMWRSTAGLGGALLDWLIWRRQQLEMVSDGWTSLHRSRGGLQAVAGRSIGQRRSKQVLRLHKGRWFLESCMFVKMPLICFAGDLYLTTLMWSYPQTMKWAHVLNWSILSINKAAWQETQALIFSFLPMFFFQPWPYNFMSQEPWLQPVAALAFTTPWVNLTSSAQSQLLPDLVPWSPVVSKFSQSELKAS